jgi:4-methylaminobutanoate oxidase (formaldehyde-forming)
MEKGYRAWGAELSPDWTPFECGLGFAVKLTKKEDFVGKTALAALKGKRLEKQLLTFTIDDGEAFPWGSESVLFNGQTVGYVTSAAYGHTVGRGVVFAMIKGVDALAATKKGGPGGKFEIEINGLLYSLTATTKPVYDPTGERVKC